MKIANLRHRMQLQTYTETPDGYAGTVKVWTTIATLSAEIISVKGYVTFDTQQIGEAITHRIMVRCLKSIKITSEHWLLMDSRRFRIRNVQNLYEQDRFLVLLCEEFFHAQIPFTAGGSGAGSPLEQDLPDEN